MYQQGDTTNLLGRRRWTSGLQGYVTSEALARRMPVQSACAPAGWTGLGLEVDPNLLAVGVGLALLAMFLLGGKTEPARRKRKRARLTKQMAELRKQLVAVE